MKGRMKGIALWLARKVAGILSIPGRTGKVRDAAFGLKVTLDTRRWEEDAAKALASMETR